MDISEYFCCDNSGTLFHVNSNLIYNIMTLITLSSGTVLTNDYTLPIIVISKVLMAGEKHNLIEQIATDKVKELIKTSGSNTVDVEIHSVTIL